MFSKSRKFTSLLRFSCLCVFLGIVNPICSDEKVVDVMVTGAFPKNSPYKDLRMIGYDFDGNLETTEFVMFEFCDTGAVVWRTKVSGEKKLIIREPSHYRLKVEELSLSEALPYNGKHFYMEGSCRILQGERRDYKTNEVIEEVKLKEDDNYSVKITKDFYDYLEAGFGDEIKYTENIYYESNIPGTLPLKVYFGVRMDSIQRMKFLESIDYDSLEYHIINDL